MSGIILASGSPRRKELMERAGLDFSIVTADVDETIPEGTPPNEAVTALAVKKARAVARDHPDRLVIGADTVVSIDGRILGKPSDAEDARRMLSLLSGRMHRVYTGIALIKNDRVKSFYDETAVHFYKLSDEEIRAYIATGEPMDKAGAYGIQGRGCTLVQRIEGDFFNVVGFPIAKIYREMRDFDV